MTTEEEVLETTQTLFYATLEVEKPPYTCPTCGWRLEYSTSYGSRLGHEYRRDKCQCEIDADERRRVDDRMRTRLSRTAELLQRSGLVGRLRRMTLDTLAVTEGIEPAVQAAAWFARDPKGCGGLILAGPVGCGKTHLAAGIGHALVLQGYPTEFQPVYALFDAIRAEYSSGGCGDVLGRLSRVPMLILDDLGNERIATGEKGDWAREQLFKLIDQRYLQELPLVVTTNYDVARLGERIGTHNVSRLLETCGSPVTIRAPDHRLRSAQARTDARRNWTERN